MSKALVIVESPAKVKSISKILGPKYAVKSSVGHIRDLAKSGAESSSSGAKKGKRTAIKPKNAEEKKALEQAKLVSRMGVDPENNWEAHYEILPGKEKVLKGLQDAAEKADTIYLATDLDREGEAIAWHLREIIGGKESRYKRVTFAEITKKTILEAFKNPSVINIDRVNAQQARRFLDRVVGYMLSPLLWAKVARGLSAGRVQSVAVRLISEREKEIHAFKPEEYWQIFVDCMNKDNFTLELTKFKGETFSATSQAQSDIACDAIKKNKLLVSSVETKPTTSKPSAPFITSTLQQAASVRLSYGLKKTMMLAQQLYEAGYITYMRTDSTNISSEAIQMSREYIESRFGKKYLPASPNLYGNKKSAQEAHEAIRPSDVSLISADMDEKIDKDAIKLYDLIWRQFVACQMPPAEFDSTSVVVTAGDYELRTRGRIMRFDGFLKVQTQIKKKGEEDVILPPVLKGETLQLIQVNPSQHFTKPPPRFTEASLVRELEKKGIGRPSTFTSIISTIQERGYVRVANRRFFCLKMGEIVVGRLKENFEDLMDYGFTASMEEHLDKIADGQEKWREVLDHFYAGFTEKLNQASVTMRENHPTLTEIGCPECGLSMNIRTARTGVFLSCSGYNTKDIKERCKGTINLIPGEETESYSEDDDEGNVAEIQNKKRCPKCDTAMDAYLIDEKRRIHVCGNNPECIGYQVEHGKFRIKGYEGPLITCDKCGDQMQLKTGRFGKYFGCNNAPTCKNTRKLLRNGEAAPPRENPVHMPELKCEKSDGYFVLRDGASGLFLASSKFPKSRETKKPLVEDLLRHKDELPPKYRYLADAPLRDPKGNPALLRFSRKSKEHYISSEANTKSTGWAAFYRQEKWVEGAEKDS